MPCDLLQNTHLIADNNLISQPTLQEDSKASIGMQNEQANDNWDIVVSAGRRPFSLNIKEIWHYRDLLILFVKRDFVAQYKQTLLGPLWHFINPIFTTLTYTLIFGNIAKISTDGTPQILFYMSGVTLWNFFSSTLTATGTTFITNANIFGKVYFPRMVSPLSTAFSKTIQFAIQMVLLLAFVVYYKTAGVLQSMEPTNFVYLPFIVLITLGFGLGLGILLSATTTKYRDLNVLVSFGIQLLMYASPVIYPLSSVPEKYRYWVELNPLTPLVECYRFVFTGSGTFSMLTVSYSALFMAVILLLGIIIFNRVEKTFMDTV